MTIIKGTNIAGPIVPFDDADTYGTHYAKFGIGGYTSVEKYNNLNEIPPERRVIGMRVKVYGDTADKNTDYDYTVQGWVKSAAITAAEAARDSAIAAKNAAQTAAGYAQEHAGIYQSVAAGLVGTNPGAYFSVPAPSSEPNTSLILYYNVNDSTATEIKRYPSAAYVESSLYNVARTFYVTMAGTDSTSENHGTSLSKPFRTVGAALAKAHLLNPDGNPGELPPAGTPCVIIVHPGEYNIEPDTVIPRNCTLYGYDLRVTKLVLNTPTPGRNMFKLSNGCKVRGFTFTNLKHEAPPTISEVGLFTQAGNETLQDVIDKGLNATKNRIKPIPGTNINSVIRGKYFYVQFDNKTSLYFNNNGVGDLVDHDYPPEGGFAFVFKPGEMITRSPYLGDCSNLHNFSYEEMTKPINRELKNPKMLRGGGNLRADGSVLNPNSPLKSVVVDSFTAINPNGYGYLITRGALVQLVSVFTNWSRIGVWCHQGGQVTIANSNTTFGDYALASTGYRHMIVVRREPNDDLQLVTDADSAALLLDPENMTEIARQLDTALRNDNTTITPPVSGHSSVGALYASFGAYDDPQATRIQQTIRDTKTLLRQIAYDLQADPEFGQTGSTRSTCFFINGLFNWNAEPVFNTLYEPIFITSYKLLKNIIRTVTGITQNNTLNTINALLDLVSTSLSNILNEFKTPQIDSTKRVAIPSIVEATGQQLSYAGTGVNYNALPYTQRGTGSSTSDVFIKRGDGRIYVTYATEIGDTYLGEDLRVDFERSTIEGQAFSRGVQNITLPFTIGIGG